MTDVQEMSARSIVALFDTNKDQRESFAQQLIDQVVEGHKNPVDISIQLKCMADIVDRVLSNERFKEALVDEVAKHGKGPAGFHNATLQVKEVGTKWDYSNTGDTALETLMAQKKKTEDAIKERQKLLQTIPDSGMADPETGAILSRASKTSSTTVAITLK